MLTIAGAFRSSVVGVALATWSAVAAQQVIVPEVAPGHGPTAFGSAMVASSGELFVAAPTGSGFIEVYRRVDGEWSSVQRVVHPGADGFGSLIAVDGDWLVASRNAPYIDMFRRVDGAWEFSQRLDLPLEVGTRLGRMKLSSESLIIAMERFHFVAVLGVKVFTYRLSGDIWGGAEELVPPHSSTYFGRALAADGDTLVVSDPHAQSVGAGGAVFTFKWVNGAWQHWSTMTGLNPPPYLNGMALALCDDRLFVTSSGPWENPPPASATGWISVYRPSAAGVGWVLEGDDLMPLTGPDVRFGTGVACSGSALAALTASNTKVTAYAVTTEGFAVDLITPDEGAVQPQVAVIGGDVALSNPASPGPEGPWSGKVTLFRDAVDPIFLGLFD